jgi:hypothetical protein
MASNPLPYRPSAFYWRRAIRTANKAGLQHIAMALVSELEIHKAFIREQGWIPPKDNVHPDEMREKQWVPPEDSLSLRAD